MKQAVIIKKKINPLRFAGKSFRNEESEFAMD